MCCYVICNVTLRYFMLRYVVVSQQVKVCIKSGIVCLQEFLGTKIKYITQTFCKYLQKHSTKCWE